MPPVIPLRAITVLLVMVLIGAPVSARAGAGEAPTVATDRSAYEVGDSFRIHWTNAPGDARDWIGLFAAGEVPGTAPPLAWQYVGGSHTASEPVVDGAVTFSDERWLERGSARWPLRTGDYEVHLLAGGTSQVLATGELTITEPSAMVPPRDPRAAPVGIVGHRGSWGPGKPPENTLAAFALAAEQGAHVIEVDATLTADGEVVIMHDPTLTRSTDAVRVFPGRDSYRVEHFTLEEIGKLTVGSYDEPQRVPTLREVADLARTAGIGLLIDMKPDHSEAPLEPAVVRVLDSLRDPVWVRERVVVAGFFDSSLQDTLQRLEGRGLQAEAAFIVNFVLAVNATVVAANPATPGLVAPGMTLDAVRDALAARGYRYFGLGLLGVQGQPANDFTAAEVDRFRDAGVELNVFSNDPDEMRSFLERGVSSVLTDHPERLSDLLTPSLVVEQHPSEGRVTHSVRLDASASPGVVAERAEIRYWRLGRSRDWTSWPAGGLNLRVGDYQIVVSAVDDAGYESRAHVAVTVSPPGRALSPRHAG